MIDGKTQVKARLVVRGFEDASRDDVSKDSPTCGKENLRLLLALMSMCNWTINTMSAFLQGKSKERDIFPKPPKLKTKLYGLCDASREWHLSTNKELLATGCVKSRYENVIFYWHRKNTPEGILSVHVNDFCRAGTNLFENIAINHI